MGQHLLYTPKTRLMLLAVASLFFMITSLNSLETRRVFTKESIDRSLGLGMPVYQIETTGWSLFWLSMLASFGAGAAAIHTSFQMFSGGGKKEEQTQQWEVKDNAQSPSYQPVHQQTVPQSPSYSPQYSPQQETAYQSPSLPQQKSYSYEDEPWSEPAVSYRDMPVSPDSDRHLAAAKQYPPNSDRGGKKQQGVEASPEETEKKNLETSQDWGS